jgi:hypothetical protein
MVRIICLLALLSVLPAFADVKLTREGERIDVTVDGKPLTSFYFGSEAPKPYLHPWRSPSGKILTRGYPMIKDVPGESKDHPHHRGIWYTHGDVNGADLWAENPKTGKVVLKSLGQVKSGKQSGSITADFDWQTVDGKKLLVEHRVMTFFPAAIDFEITLKNEGAEKVKLGDTKEGAFAIRVVKSLEEKTPKCPACTGVMLNSEGAQGEKAVWGKRARWVDYSGTVEGENLGISIFDHPSNPKHPTYWHARGYGLFAVNPFGEHDYYNDKTRDGSLTIDPGGKLTFRYRVWVHAGDAASAKVEEEYQKWVRKH